MKQSAYIGNRYIVYDDCFLGEQECYSLLDSHEQLLNSQQRGTAIFIDHADYHFVAKHYQRGGLIRYFNKDWYFACHATHSRAFKEWNLLYQLRDIGLPVPKPIASNVELRACFYQADLMTERIDAVPLSQYLMKDVMEQLSWRQLGQTIKQFHQHAVYHEDLNASNILIDSNMQFFLIDFDKARIKSGATWKVDNLFRLRRSLTKYTNKNPGFSFTNENWQQLVASYRDA